MRIGVFDPKKRKNQNPDHQYTFYEVLQVLYKFIDDESQHDKGEVLIFMKKLKKNLIDAAVDLGNLAYLNNWYDLSLLESPLEELVVYDEVTGYSPNPKLVCKD